MDPKYEHLVGEALRDPQAAFQSLVFSDDKVLFSVCMESEILWEEAKLMLETECPEPSFAEHLIQYDPAPKIPHELIAELPHFMDLRTLTAFSRTCKGFHRECCAILEELLCSVFDDWGLGLTSFRFMLTQTGSVVSGSFLLGLLRMDGRPTTSYMDVRTGFGLEQVEWVLSDKEFVHATTTYSHRSGNFEILVHSCIGIFVAYPDLTFDGVAIVSHNYVRLRTLEEECQLSLLQREVNSYGVRIVPFHHDRLQPGVLGLTYRDCDASSSCPSRHRNTFDTLSFQYIFRTTGWHRGWGRRDLQWDIYWVLGSMGCAVENKRVEFDLKLERREHRTDDDARYIALLEETLSQ
ncbi:hypothetical protein B0H12DRAFT_1231913 [Mycena haematopus]|nr:hypothetical protein B0H12DRAFT_1231913 [Mycena haematopus]